MLCYKHKKEQSTSIQEIKRRYVAIMLWESTHAGGMGTEEKYHIKSWEKILL